MIKVSAEFDFTRIRKYHHNIEFLASSAENRQEPINTVYQDVFIDLKTENDYKTFVISFEQLLETYNLQDENVLEILYLAQLTYADIETATEINFELLETHVNLTFLKEVIRLQEADKARKAKQSKNIKQYADLDLTIQSLNGSITLKNPIVTDFVIAQLVKAFRDKSYNFQLATALENQEITYSNLSKIIKELNYRTSDVNRF
ncbi:MAG: hypothetical protein JWQ84_182, partial [Mucilaginibacter sp.]|nr:hypothetical protein [Mucilaginibacter sp.]